MCVCVGWEVNFRSHRSSWRARNVPHSSIWISMNEAPWEGVGIVSFVESSCLNDCHCLFLNWLFWLWRRLGSSKWTGSSSTRNREMKAMTTTSAFHFLPDILKDDDVVVNKTIECVEQIGPGYSTMAKGANGEDESEFPNDRLGRPVLINIPSPD